MYPDNALHRVDLAWSDHRTTWVSGIGLHGVEKQINGRNPLRLEGQGGA